MSLVALVLYKTHTHTQIKKKKKSKAFGCHVATIMPTQWLAMGHLCATQALETALENLPGV